MAYEQKNNSGAVFKNADKTDANPSWPDLQGKAMIGGVMFYVSGWAKKKDNGEKWLSLAFKEIERKPEPAPEPAGEQQREDDLPF